MINNAAAGHLSCKCASHRELWKKVEAARAVEDFIFDTELFIAFLNAFYMFVLIPVSWYSSLVIAIIILNSSFNSIVEPMWLTTIYFLKQITPWWEIFMLCGMMVLQEVIIAALEKTIILQGVGQPDWTGRILLKINLIKCIVALLGRTWALWFRNREAWRFLCRFEKAEAATSSAATVGKEATKI
jgi:hypothetical protein